MLAGLTIGAIAWCLGLADTPPIDPGAPGPFPVGVLTVTVRDADRNGRTIVTEIWYPADGGDAASAAGHAGLRAPRRNVPAAPGRFPLVVFSHGHGAGRTRYQFLTAHLASHGLVVAAPDHQHDTLEDLDLLRFFHPEALVETVMDRPMDVRVVADFLLRAAAGTDHLLRGRLDGRVGVVGHSLGGSTALAVGGAWIFAPTGATPGQPANRHYRDFADPRVQTVVALAPVYQNPFASDRRLPHFDPRGIERLRVPALIVGSSEDRVTPFATQQSPIFDCIGGAGYLARIAGAAHLSFNDEEFVRLLPIAVRMFDRPTIDRARADTAIRRLLLAFLDRHLSGNDRFAQHLQPQPGIEVRSRPAPVNATHGGGHKRRRSPCRHP